MAAAKPTDPDLRDEQPIDQNEQASPPLIASHNALNEGAISKIRAAFDQDWYRITYAAALRAANAGSDPFDYYLNVGAKLGQDPNRTFSELLYRQRNRDVLEHIAADQTAFAFRHWIEHGQFETGRVRPTLAEANAIRNVFQHLDPDFIADEYAPPTAIYPSPADFYFRLAKSMSLSPSPYFSEEAYILDNQDVTESDIWPSLWSGFDHFLRFGNKEQRRVTSHTQFKTERAAKLAKLASRATLNEAANALESNLPGITHPSALEAADAMDFYSQPIVIETDSGPPELLVVLPNFLPEILFGGYQALYSVLDSLKQQGTRLKLLVASSGTSALHAHNLVRMSRQEPQWMALFERIDRLDESRRINVKNDTYVLSYSAETHYLAQQIAAFTGKLPFFFIQDYEPDFHAEGDMRNFSKDAFRFPHIGIYNSAKLLEYFESQPDTLVSRATDYRRIAFENWIKPMPNDVRSMMSAHPASRRRLIFYGRPESHATRNIFATFVRALRLAIRSQVFEPIEDWEFISIGSLRYEGDIDLGLGCKLEVRAKMPLQEYEALLLSGDIGASFITTPHPGIIHFQMAAFGLTTLTNVTKLRNEAWLSKQSGNLIGVHPSVEAIAEGLGRAVRSSVDIDERRRNARMMLTPSKEQCLKEVVQFVMDEMK